MYIHIYISLSLTLSPSLYIYIYNSLSIYLERERQGETRTYKYTYTYTCWVFLERHICCTMLSQRTHIPAFWPGSLKNKFRVSALCRHAFTVKTDYLLWLRIQKHIFIRFRFMFWLYRLWYFVFLRPVLEVEARHLLCILIAFALVPQTFGEATAAAVGPGWEAKGGGRRTPEQVTAKKQQLMAT